MIGLVVGRLVHESSLALIQATSQIHSFIILKRSSSSFCSTMRVASILFFILNPTLFSVLAFRAQQPTFLLRQHNAATYTNNYTALRAKSKTRSKQLVLREKLAIAKQQNAEETKDKSRMTDEEIKEQNDRLRFEEMLKTKGSSVLNEYSSDGYLSKQQEEEEISAAGKCGHGRVSML